MSLRAPHANSTYHEKIERTYWFVSNFVSIVGILVAVAAVLYAKNAFEQAQRQAKASEDLIALQYPAKIKIVRIGIKQSGSIAGDIDFAVIKKYNVHVYSVNYGRADAVVKEARIMPYWSKGMLPMDVPYFDPKHEQSIIMSFPKILGDAGSSPKPGQFLDWNFNIDVPKDYEPEMRLYIIGYIKYADGRNPYRITLFGRRYDVAKNRFVPVDDPAYEEPDLN